ncbi:MAG TPA: hypothetical protein VHZ95_21065 [Polyangiales bacterium]|nr:hypothetical protein [Polyangiales bacterium]
MRAYQPGKLEVIVSQTAGDLEYIDVPTATVVTHVPTGTLAHWIALDTDRSLAFVTNEGDDNVSVVDLAKRLVLATVPVGDAPRKMALQQ